MREKFDPSLHLVTNRAACGERPLLEVVERALDGGITVVQLREKELSTQGIVRIGMELHKLTQKYNVPLIVNDNIHAALAIDAEGVHVGQKDTPADEARKLIGTHKILGVSVTTVTQALRAQEQGADYLGIGPIYATRSKPDAGLPIGLEPLSFIRNHPAITLPLVAIGGITKHNAPDVIRAGAHGIAVVSAILAQPNVRMAAANLCFVMMQAA